MVAVTSGGLLLFYFIYFLFGKGSYQKKFVKGFDVATWLSVQLAIACSPTIISYPLHPCRLGGWRLVAH